MLAKSVMRNATGLRSRISEQVVIYNEWKKLAEEFNDKEVQGILTDARWKLIESIRMKRNIEQIIMANPNADEREVLRLRYFYGATWAAIADELGDTTEWVKKLHKKALKRIKVEKGCDCGGEFDCEECPYAEEGTETM